MKSLNLIPMEDHLVYISTQEDYDTLMQIYESGEWNRCGMSKKGRNPTTIPTDLNTLKDIKKEHLERICFEIKDNFQQTALFWANREKKKVISLKELCDYQKITEEDLKDIKRPYERFKPYRKSKGLKI